jgi:limonene-1,2-epoxide hydrolase
MTPDDFPEVFATGWALPKPDGFVDFFLPLIAEDAVFAQPSFPDARGHNEIARMFRQLFTLFPDLTPTPLRSAVVGDAVFIESDCATTVGRRVVRFPVCDRFIIRDGKIQERRSFSDPIPTMAALARTPQAWARAIRSRTLR